MADEGKNVPPITQKGDAERNAELCKVSVKIPPFYPEKPALWFAQVEGQFSLSNITVDATKFYYTIAHLDPQYAAEVEEIILTPPAQDKYEKLKSELIKRLTASREKKMKQLLSHEELGDRRPSQFLRHLQDLAGPGLPEDFLRTLWSNRLPAGTQTIIASQMKCSLEELAELADRIHDVVAPTPHVAAVSTTTAPSVDLVTAQIAALSKQVEALTSKLDRMSRSRERSSSRSRQRSGSARSHSNYRKFPTCWYHYKFGGQAKRCIKPCDYEAGNALGSR